LALASALNCPGPLAYSEVEVEVVTAGIVQTVWERIEHAGRTGAVRLPLLVGALTHPRGTILVDAGLGQQTRDGHYPRFPLSTSNIEVPAGHTVFERYGAPLKVLLTHLHYDHVGGLLDLPNAEVWTTLAEWTSTRARNVAFPESAMRDAVDWHVVDLQEGRAQQVLDRPAIDVMGDGTIWYLSTPGHTPGSASVLVLTRTQPWLFIGDIAWVDSHLENLRRPGWVSLVVDGEPRALTKSLKWARELKQKCPSLQIVAGHEPRWQLTEGLPK